MLGFRAFEQGDPPDPTIADPTAKTCFGETLDKIAEQFFHGQFFRMRNRPKSLTNCGIVFALAFNESELDLARHLTIHIKGRDAHDR